MNGVIDTQDEKDRLEAVCKPPHVYHWHVVHVNGDTGPQCGQRYAETTSVRRWVNCKKCLRALGVEG